MSLAISGAVTLPSPLLDLARREDLGRLVRFGAGTTGAVVAGGLLVLMMTSSAAACTGTTLMATAVQLPALTQPA